MRRLNHSLIRKLFLLYMYICMILNKPKRSREFFAMRGFSRIWACFLLRAEFVKNGREPTQTYTNIHGYTRTYTGGGENGRWIVRI
jgi:hypothetical protein